MVASLQTSTPPPPTSIRTPTTPRFGFDDSYEPFSPRKSARVRSRAAHTPPPQGPRAARTPRTSRKSAASSPDSSITSSPSSPQTATKKRAPRHSPTMSGRTVSGALNFDGTAVAAAALGLPQPKNQTSSSRATIMNSGMLPTPAKTPKRDPSDLAPVVASVARNLFPPSHSNMDDAMPSPKKKGKKYKGFTMDSFEAEEDDAPIPIYTDSHERIPEVDMSSDNPFFGQNSAQPESSKRASKRRKIAVPGEGLFTEEELEKREDGMVYVFRGKKSFKKFADLDNNKDAEEDEGEEAGTEEVGIGMSPESRRLTRASVKPRLLFPNAHQMRAKELREMTTEDEEAETEIDESMVAVTPKSKGNIARTPQAPRFGPTVTPPSTRRTTRSKDLELDRSPAGTTSDDDAPATSTRSDSASPFLTWAKTKGATKATTGKGKKRQGEALLTGLEKKRKA